MPDQKGRLEILKVHARNKKLGEDVDLSEVASRVPGFTGADLANLLNEVSHHPPVHTMIVGLLSVYCLLVVISFVWHSFRCAMYSLRLLLTSLTLSHVLAPYNGC